VYPYTTSRQNRKNCAMVTREAARCKLQKRGLGRVRIEGSVHKENTGKKRGRDPGQDEGEIYKTKNPGDAISRVH